MPILETLQDNSILIDDKVKELKKRAEDAPEVDKLEKQWDIKKHAIYTDIVRFPDPKKKVKNADGNEETKTIPLTRIGLPYQKKIINTGVTFYCGIPITYAGDEGDNKFEAFKKVLESVKSEFIDADVRQAYGRWTECAEYWYTVEEENSRDRYGFESKFKVRCNILTPDKYQMFPIFDNNQDLVCFSFQYKADKKDRIDTFTADKVYKWIKNEMWELESEIDNPFGLIPINFYREPDGRPEYYDVQDAIERLEYIYSATAESNNDFAFPILSLFGEVTGAFSQKQGGRVLQFDNDSKGAEYVTPDDNNGIEKERKTLERDIHDFTDTPDISLTNMQGLGNILSGVGAEFLFLSAHQKVVRNNKIFEPALKRRISIISSILSKLNVNFKEDLDVVATIHPFKIEDFKAKLETYLKGLDGQQIFSLRWVLQKLGIEDPEGMMAEIIKESEEKTNERAVEDV